MDNKAKYNKAFTETFSIDENKLKKNLEYNTIPEWDSIGHMTLIGSLEEAFGISMETDDIIDFSSYNKGLQILKKYKVDMIYTHWAGDSNQDHMSTFKTTMAAARYVKNVYCYEQIPIPRHTENQMRINHYVDVTDIFKDKIIAAECHKSQFKKYNNIGFNVKENLKTLAKFRGIQANCKYAEAFQVVKQVR